MSWLKNHMRHFVLPGIRALAKAGSKGVRADAVPAWSPNLRASPKCKWSEAGLLYAAVSSAVPKDCPSRELTLDICRHLHLSRPADVAVITGPRASGLSERFNARGPDVVHSILCNSLRTLKRRVGKETTLVLPGRDVWAWEVLARRQSMRTVFDPRLSRMVSYCTKALLQLIDDWQVDWEKAFVFDTGFAGSIRNKMCAALQQDVPFLLLSAGSDVEKRQLYPRHTGSRAKALAIEYFPKYWKSGTVRDDKPVQYLAKLDEFLKAALLTIWLWRHVSPRRVNPKEKSSLRVVPIPNVTLTTGTDLSVQQQEIADLQNLWGQQITATSLGLTVDATSATTSHLNWATTGGSLATNASGSTFDTFIPITTQVILDSDGNPITG